MDTPSAASFSGDAIVPLDVAGDVSVLGSVGAPQSNADAASEPPGEALYNPFATTGSLLQVNSAPPIIEHSPPAGDWSLPVTVTLTGFILIGWMVRVMVQ